MSMNKPEMKVKDRDAEIVNIVKFFAYKHLSEDLQPTSQQFYDLAANMVNDLPDSGELAAGLRKLLEAKDCFVRAAVGAREETK